ncbi:hypothetical protein ACFRKD_32145 [Streptomyces niveus]|uniref:hypothetical protein n=1 Tax=Streptomyces niveus TaxID=193462 RepID=UPI0036C72142
MNEFRKLRIQPDKTFKCDGCGSTFDRKEFVFVDGKEVWTVDAEGAIGCVVDPAVSLTEMTEACEKYLAAEGMYAQLSALEDHRTALMAFLEAKRVGIDPPPTYTLDQVHDAVNEGADIVNDSLGLGEPETDAINLAVNGALACLEKPGITFEEMVDRNYGEDTVEDIRSWWGWGK